MKINYSNVLLRICEPSIFDSTIKRNEIMTTQEKGKVIADIMVALKNQAFLLGKEFDSGIFFDLIFKSDKEIIKIKNLCKI